MRLDPNSWFRLTTATTMTSQLSMVGTFPYMDGNKGPVSFATADNDAPVQNWHLYPVGASYVLRTRASGPEGYLGIIPTLNVNGTVKQIKPWILNLTETDAAMLWKLRAWDDGTFSLSNSACGHNCYLDFTGTESISISTNVTQPQPGQVFSLVQLGKINDPAFSTVKTRPPSPSTSTVSSYSITSIRVNIESSIPALGGSTLPTSSVTSPPSALSRPSRSTSIVSSLASTSLVTTDVTALQPSNTQVLESTPTSTLNTHHRLSTSASMGIGVTIGVFGLISLTAIGLFLYRRWKKRRSAETLHHRRTKLWKGFTPQHLSCAIIDTTYDDKILIAELPTPASVFSPPFATPQLAGDRRSWRSSSSYYSQQYAPYSPDTPGPSPAELPV